MATRFSVWIDTPISGTNVQSFTAFSNDEQRKAGFTANTPASSIRVNTALREATLFATGFMKAFFDNSTLDATSTVAQMAAALSGLIMTKSQVQNYVTEQINTSVPEQVETLFNDKIIITNVPISEGDELTSGTIYLYYGG